MLDWTNLSTGQRAAGIFLSLLLILAWPVMFLLSQSLAEHAKTAGALMFYCAVLLNPTSFKPGAVKEAGFYALPLLCRWLMALGALALAGGLLAN